MPVKCKFFSLYILLNHTAAFVFCNFRFTFLQLLIIPALNIYNPEHLTGM